MPSLRGGTKVVMQFYFSIVSGLTRHDSSAMSTNGMNSYFGCV